MGQEPTMAEEHTALSKQQPFKMSFLAENRKTRKKNLWNMPTLPPMQSRLSVSYVLKP